ncbi:MAG TPA: hypothetical protein VD713_04815 [Sphingomonadales bacterium]|nr:hypothetical protein [Sphingomonadales bacterium]
MTNPSNMKTETTPAQSEGRTSILKEIGAKWNKFSEQDLSGLQNRDDLVTEVVAKYSIDKSQAQRDVDSVLKGRGFSA